MAMTDEERFHFDVAGFLVRPAVLPADEVAELRGHVDQMLHRWDDMPPHLRHVAAGPGTRLIDHPRIVDVLEAVIGPDIRYENGFAVWRGKEESHAQGLHQGGANQGDPVFGYRVHQGRIFAGLVRVVVELTDVRPGDGGTVFLAGSHKANFPAPPGHLSLAEGERSPLLRGYDCPAGSVIFFTENLIHAGPRWQGDEPRVAILNAYGNLAVNFHRPSMAPEVVAALPRETQAWMRPPWLFDFSTWPPERNSPERFVDAGERTYADVLRP
jgi:ectoine hydroxylase-related dioxygenase (phytanoyl-CoA dioxygenase family)